MRVKTRVDGRQLRDLKAKLAAIGKPDVYEEALDLAALSVERNAAIRAPVNEGEMRSAIFIQKEPGVRFVGSDKRQAVFTELSPRLLQGATPENPRTDWPAKRERGGGARQTMPWLRPALLDSRDYIKRVFSAALKRRVDSP